MSGGGGKREADKLVKDLRRYLSATRSPYEVAKLSGGHWGILRSATGARIMTFASTPSDVRFRHNTVARLRHKGVVARDFR